MRKVLRTAKNEAKVLGHTYVGTEHILLGLLAETEGPAWKIFRMAGINLETTRQEILVELGRVFKIKNEHRTRQTGL